MSFDLKISKGDLVISQGNVQRVIDSEKLIQDILKVCLTDIGSNPIHTWYGSSLSRSVVGSAETNDFIIQIAQSQLNNALENIKSLQQLQVKSFQKVSADEQIGAILDISIARNITDLRLFDIKIKCLTKGSKPITTNFRVSTI